MGDTNWKSAYRIEHLRGLKFRTIPEFEQAMELAWEDPEFRGMWFDTHDGYTLFVPKEAVALFRARKLKFKVYKNKTRYQVNQQKIARTHTKKT